MGAEVQKKYVKSERHFLIIKLDYETKSSEIIVDILNPSQTLSLQYVMPYVGEMAT